MPHSGESYAMNPAVARMKEQMATSAPEQAQPDSPTSNVSSIVIEPAGGGYKVLCNYGDGTSEEKSLDADALVQFIGDKVGGYANGEQETAPGNGDRGAPPGAVVPEE